MEGGRKESFLKEEPFENNLGGERVTRWHSRQRNRPVWRLEKQCVQATVDFLGPHRDFGPDPAKSQGGGCSSMFTWVFCKVLLAALFRAGWRESFEEAQLSKRDGGGLAQRWIWRKRVEGISLSFQHLMIPKRRCTVPSWWLEVV